MVITFGNQKGGVGKTTLCTLFANYLASIGKKTLVVDCDNQQTITEKRKADKKKYTDAKFFITCSLSTSPMWSTSKTSWPI